MAGPVAAVCQLFSFRKRLLICPLISCPRDLAASNIHGCLYIIEVGRSPELLVCLDAATGEVKAQRWCDLLSEARNLAVDQRTGNVILTCAKKIVEYDHNGQLIRTVALPEEGMDMLWQAVPRGDNQFVITQVGFAFAALSRKTTGWTRTYRPIGRHTLPMDYINILLDTVLASPVMAKR